MVRVRSTCCSNFYFLKLCFCECIFFFLFVFAFAGSVSPTTCPAGSFCPIGACSFNMYVCCVINCLRILCIIPLCRFRFGPTGAMPPRNVLRHRICQRIFLSNRIVLPQFWRFSPHAMPLWHLRCFDWTILGQLYGFLCSGLPVPIRLQFVRTTTLPQISVVRCAASQLRHYLGCV